MFSKNYVKYEHRLAVVLYDMDVRSEIYRAVPGMILCRSLKRVLEEIGKRQAALVLVHVTGETDVIVDDLPHIRHHLRGSLLVTADEITLSLIHLLAKHDVRAVVPFRHEEIANAVKQAAEKTYLRDPFDDIVFRSEAMKEVLHEAATVASMGRPVLITGQTGTGKDLIARAVHSAGRGGGPFVAENVAGLDDTLFSDAIFGHEKGAFTNADQRRRGKVRTAEHGTLFLDEVGDLSPRSQVKLLRLIERGEFYPLGSTQPVQVDVRFVLATNRDIRTLVQEGVFRKDLYYRLAYHTLHLPPLDDRREDIPLLVDHFIEEAVDRFKRGPITVPQETMELLCAWDYPGNVRQLRSQIFNAVMLCKGSQLSPQYLSDPISLFQDQLDAAFSKPEEGARELTFPNRLPEVAELATELVREAMRRSGGNQSKAARMLGVTPSAVNKRLQADGS